MTAPTEPLKLTLEELLERVWEQGDVLYREPGLPGWIHRVDNEKRIKVTPCSTWERAGKVALGREVVARDPAAELEVRLTDCHEMLQAQQLAAAELRAALEQAARRISAVLNYHGYVISTSARESLNEVARAALAATEGEEA